ncbi:MAG: hypothetical protein ACLFSV_08070 [Alkalispirochaeta sp.]
MTGVVRFVIIGVVVFVVALGFVVYDGFFVLAETPILEESENGYLFRLWSVGVLEHLPLLVIITAVLTFSLALSPHDLGGQGMLSRAIAPVLFLIVGIGILYGVWVGGIEPRVRLRMQEIEYHSEVARNAWDDARTAMEAGRIDAAERYARIYRSVVGANDEVDTFLAEIYEIKRAEERARVVASWAADDETEVRYTEQREAGIADLMAQARRYYEDGRYFSAHYYASRAVELSEGRQDARNLQSRALNAIEREGMEIDDRPVRELFRRKQHAHLTFERGQDGNPEALIEAYYLFNELYREDPDDPDLRRYVELATVAVEEISFYIDDAEFYDDGTGFPGHRDVVFRNRSGDELTEFITAERVVQTPAGVFFYDVEIYRDTPDGPLHFFAYYGKRIEDNLFFRAIEDVSTGGGERRIVEPRMIDGNPEEIPAFVPLRLTTGEMIHASRGRDTFGTLSLVELVRLPSLLTRIGRPAAPALSALAERLLRLFGVFIGAFAVIGIAWRHRSYYLGRPPLPVLLAVPVIPMAVWWLREVPYLTLSIIVHGALEYLSAGGVIAVVIALLFLLLIISVGSVGRLRVEP